MLLLLRDRGQDTWDLVCSTSSQPVQVAITSMTSIGEGVLLSSGPCRRLQTEVKLTLLVVALRLDAELVAASPWCRMLFDCMYLSPLPARCSCGRRRS